MQADERESMSERHVHYHADGTECCGKHDQGEDHECTCGHDHGHEHHHAHGEECGCGHEHHHHGDDCGCGHDHHHDHWDYDRATEPAVINMGDGFMMVDFYADDETELTAPEAEEFDFEHNGVTYHARRWGNPEKRPVLMLHGFMQTGAGWDFVASELGLEYCVYALDFVGHGASGKPAEADHYSYDAAVETAAAFLREVACPHPETGEIRKAHVVGYSMGGRVALGLLSTCKELLQTVCLESCNLGPVDEEERAAAAERNAEWAARLRTDGMENFVAFWEELPLFATQKERGLHNRLRAERCANDAEAMALCLEGMGKHTMPLEHESVRVLMNSWLPIKYVWGTEDEGCRRVARMLDERGLDVSATSTGHNTHAEAPMIYLRLVRDFFAGNELKGLL